MIRHIFMGRFKPGISDEIKEKELADMKLMKEKMPMIADQQVGFMLGWEGMKDGIAMTVDLATKADFDAYMTHPYHAEYIARTGLEYFIHQEFAVAQFEI